LKRRETLLREELEGRLSNTMTVSDEDFLLAARAGVGRTISELKSATRDFVRRRGSLIEHVSAILPAVSLSTYHRRLKDSVPEDASISDSPKKELLEEAYLLAYLHVEGGDPLLPADEWVRDNWVAVRKNEVIKDEWVRARLDEAFTVSK
jgi:hypothetical protein